MIPWNVRQGAAEGTQLDSIPAFHVALRSDFALIAAPDAPVLVTGCAGFIGMHTALALLAPGRQVTGVDNLDPYYDVGLKAARLARL